MPVFLDAALARAGRSRFATRPAGGGFSLVEHACHLRDLEREGYLLRFMRLLAESYPVLEGFEGERVAADRDYLAQDAIAAARRIRRGAQGNPSASCAASVPRNSRARASSREGP